MARTSHRKADAAGGPADGAADSSLGYEQAIERLEEIIEQIEAGEVTLEQSLERYAEGVRLIGHCRGVLDRAEQRIAELTVTESGGLREVGSIRPAAGAAGPAGTTGGMNGDANSAESVESDDQT